MKREGDKENIHSRKRHSDRSPLHSPSRLCLSLSSVNEFSLPLGILPQYSSSVGLETPRGNEEIVYHVQRWKFCRITITTEQIRPFERNIERTGEGIE